MNDQFTVENKYVQWLTVPCYQTDAAFILKPASFMDMMQELAYKAAKHLGFGYEALQTHGTAWVLSRMHFKFINPPRWRDEVMLETWHKGLDGLFFLRDFNLKDKEGKVLACCTSSWIVLRMDTRRLVRSDELLDLVSADTQCHDDAISKPSGKVVIPSGLEIIHAGTRQVAYSDVDIIGHTNNARYIVWAMDALPFEEVSQKRISDIEINFNKETRPGDVVEICIAREGDTYYVEGLLEDNPAFTSKICLENV